MVHCGSWGMLRAYRAMGLTGARHCQHPNVTGLRVASDVLICRGIVQAMTSKLLWPKNPVEHVNCRQVNVQCLRSCTNDSGEAKYLDIPTQQLVGHGFLGLVHRVYVV